MEATIAVRTQCPVCMNGKTFALDAEALREWREGRLIQLCFPGLSADDHERLVSGLCPECWDETFSPKVD